MTEAEQLSKLRHDLANPLSAILAESQLLLLDHPELPPDVLAAVRQIESLAIRMRAMLKASDPA